MSSIEKCPLFLSAIQRFSYMGCVLIPAVPRKCVRYSACPPLGGFTEVGIHSTFCEQKMAMLRHHERSHWACTVVLKAGNRLCFVPNLSRLHSHGWIKWVSVYGEYFTTIDILEKPFTSEFNEKMPSNFIASETNSLDFSVWYNDCKKVYQNWSSGKYTFDPKIRENG